MREVVVLSLLASLNPTLVAATTMMMLLDRPVRLMAGYLAGAYVTSITLGLVIVFALPNSDATKSVKRTLSPAVDLALGLIFVGVALVLHSGRHERLLERRRERKSPDKQPPRWQRELAKGTPRTTFAIGAILTLPGASYLAGLDQIHRLHTSALVVVLIVLGFNFVMLWLLEIPLIAFLRAPERTPKAIERAKSWIGGHIYLFAVRGLAVIGLVLVLKGILGLLNG